MPRWRHLCKEGEEPSKFVGGKKLQEELGCEHSVGWSDIPEEWVPAVKELVDRIRERWTVDGSGILFVRQKPVDVKADVRISQIKDKFGTLRFYYSAPSDVFEEIEKLVDECEERLAKDDPYYGEPY